MTKWHPTQWKPPRTGEKQLRVIFRNGEVSKHTYSAKQLNWQDRGEPFDIIELRIEKEN